MNEVTKAAAQSPEKQALIEATKHLSEAYVGLVQAQGGVDIMTLGVMVQLITVQLDAMVEVACQGDPALMTKFHQLAAKKMKEAESGLRKATLNIPKLVLPDGSKLKPNG